VGAGPGAPELLTVKGYLALEADVVFFDDLVSPEILDVLPAVAAFMWVSRIRVPAFPRPISSVN
jgi:siroheme synthase